VSRAGRAGDGQRAPQLVILGDAIHGCQQRFLIARVER
jgi:hypothetical protein